MCIFLFDNLEKTADNLEHLLVVLKVEREVLGPCKEGGIRLAELVVRQSLIGE